jgi:hypothetical protein
MSDKKSEINVTALAQSDRADWKALYHGCGAGSMMAIIRFSV